MVEEAKRTTEFRADMVSRFGRRRGIGRENVPMLRQGG